MERLEGDTWPQEYLRRAVAAFRPNVLPQLTRGRRIPDREKTPFPKVPQRGMDFTDTNISIRVDDSG